MIPKMLEKLTKGKVGKARFGKYTIKEENGIFQVYNEHGEPHSWGNTRKEAIEKSKSQSTTQPYLELTPQVKEHLAGAQPKAGGLPQEIPEPVKKTTEALKGAKSRRTKQEAIYRKERSRKLAKSLGMAKGKSGEAWLHARIAGLKGEMTKVDFESIRGQLTEKNITDLFNMIRDSQALNEWQKVNAGTAMMKLLGQAGGTVPTKGELKLLKRVYGQQFVEAALTNRAFMQKLGDWALEAANLPRAIMASFDLSAPLRQGVVLVGRKEFYTAFAKMFRVAGNQKAYDALMSSIYNHPDYKLADEAGLSLTDVEGGLSEREEAFIGAGLAEKIPVIGPIVRFSNRAYVGFLNKLRMDTFSSIVRDARNSGIDVDEDFDKIKNIATFINSATGRGDLGRFNQATALLNATFFSPRLIASRFNLISPSYYAKLDPFTRKQALKSVLSFVALGMTVLGIAKMRRLEVGTDITSADFGKIKIGNTRIDIWGGFLPVVRTIGQLIIGKKTSSITGKTETLGEGYKPLNRLDIIQRFFENKLAPLPSLIVESLRGKTGIGEDFTVGEALKRRFTFMVVQDAVELAQDNPRLLPLVGAAIFGVGLQTYGPSTLKQKREAERWKALPVETRRAIEARKSFKWNVNKRKRRIKNLKERGRIDVANREIAKLQEFIRRNKPQVPLVEPTYQPSKRGLRKFLK
jgi:hypothetical protein